MNGKNKCKILKEIRRQIARENGIAYVTSECKFQGNCSGTCPKCEAEVRYLEQELRKRQQAGKAVAVAGIAAAMLVGAAGCFAENRGLTDMEKTPIIETTAETCPAPPVAGEIAPETDPEELLMGAPPEPVPEDILQGEPAWDPTGEVDEEIPVETLMGDIALPEEEWIEGEISIEEPEE